jgi:hypothetical protein
MVYLMLIRGVPAGFDGVPAGFDGVPAGFDGVFGAQSLPAPAGGGGEGGPAAVRSRLRRHHKNCENFYKNQKPNG